MDGWMRKRHAELFFIGRCQTEPVQGQRNAILIKTKEERLNISGAQQLRMPTRPVIILPFDGRKERRVVV